MDAPGERHDVLVFEDLARAFDWKAFEGGMRARFASYLANLVNEKWRVWMFRFLPPPPVASAPLGALVDRRPIAGGLTVSILVASRSQGGRSSNWCRTAPSRGYIEPHLHRFGWGACGIWTELGAASGQALPAVA